jgi:gamma-glutamylcyclotransferase
VKWWRRRELKPRMKPYHWYKEFVVRGAEEHGLPAGYIVGIRAVESQEDRYEGRRNKNQALLKEGA